MQDFCIQCVYVLWEARKWAGVAARNLGLHELGKPWRPGQRCM